ncbi:hypothetical protein RDABS01_013129 [Bienertia sinuspersici]
MQPGCGKRIGNRQSTLILEDTWAGNLPVKFKRNIPPNHGNAPKHVKEPIRGRSWDASKVWHYFNRSDAQRNLFTYIPQQEKEDEIIWLHKENGNYLRWRIFCWRLAHDALPTRGNLVKRRIEINPSCVFCGNKESSDHMFLNCEITKRIWSSSDLDLVAILWAIWLHRNNVIFGNVKPNPQEVLNLTNIELERWYRGFEESTGKGDKSTLTSIIKDKKITSWSWGNTIQEENILKIDGAWKVMKNGGIQATYGWVMEHGNRCIQEKANRIFAASPLQAEAQAMLEGISSARIEWLTVAIFTDFERMIQTLHKPESAPTNCYFLILDILFVLKTFTACSIYKVCRSNVRRAHELATQARQGP